MSSHANEHVFKWLNNIPLSACICPLCDDTTECCKCYTDLTSFSDVSSMPHTASSDLFTIHLDKTGGTMPTNNIEINELKMNNDRRTRYTQRPAAENDDDTSSTGSSLIKGCSVEIVRWNVTGADLLLKAGDTLFPVHRSILTKHSRAFHNKLNRSEKLVIELPAVKARYLQIVLEYLYNHEVVLTKSNAGEILRIAEKYEMYTLIESCNNYLQRSSHLRFLKKQKRWKILHDILGFKIF